MDGSRRSFLKRAAGLGLAASPAVARASAMGSVHSSMSQAPIPAANPGETVLAFAGDFFLTQPLPARLAVGTEQVFDTMRGADVAFANLENGLSTVGSPELGGYRWGAPLRGAPSLVKQLSRAGIEVVSTANNHTGNYGREALLETLTTLDAAGVRHAGAGRTVEEAFRPTHVNVNGLKVAFFSIYCCHYNRVSSEMATPDLAGVAMVRAYDVLMEVPGNFEERNVPPNIFPMRLNPAVSVMAPLREDVIRLTDAIRKGRGEADLAVLYVHFHWARHTKPDVPYQQRVIAHAALDAGIDVFVAHGPHTLRGIETYRGKPILFSIGNFILQPSKAGSKPNPLNLGHQSVVVRTIVAEKKLNRLELLPIDIGADGQPQFARDDVGQMILNRVSGLSAEFGTDITKQDWYGAIPLDVPTAGNGR